MSSDAPEGPEVWALARLVNRYYGQDVDGATNSGGGPPAGAGSGAGAVAGGAEAVVGKRKKKGDQTFSADGSLRAGATAPVLAPLECATVAAISYGTHLLLDGTCHYFGSTGRLVVSRDNADDLLHIGAAEFKDDGAVTRTSRGYFHAAESAAKMAERHGFGPDWMTATLEELRVPIAENAGGRVPLGLWLSNPRNIAGLGPCWTSEVCAHAKLRPDICMNMQNLKDLPASLVAVRDFVAHKYAAFVDSRFKPATAMFHWPGNLYTSDVYPLALRTTEGVSRKVVVKGRTFWIPA